MASRKISRYLEIFKYFRYYADGYGDIEKSHNIELSPYSSVPNISRKILFMQLLIVTTLVSMSHHYHVTHINAGNNGELDIESHIRHPEDHVRKHVRIRRAPASYKESA